MAPVGVKQWHCNPVPYVKLRLCCGAYFKGFKMAQFVKYFPAGFAAQIADTLVEGELAHGRVDNFGRFVDTAFGINIGTKKAQVVKTMAQWVNDAKDGQSGIKGYKIRANIATLFTVALATLDGLPCDDGQIHNDFLTLWQPAKKAPATAKKASDKSTPASEASEAPEASDKSAASEASAAIPAPGDIVAGTIALVQSGLIGRDSLAALESAIAAYHAARVAPVATPATPSEALI